MHKFMIYGVLIVVQVIALARDGHYAVGYELNIWLVLYSRLKALVGGVSSRTEFHRKDLWKVQRCSVD